MKIYKLAYYENICNEIRYEIENGILSSLEFLLDGKPVLSKLQKKLNGVEIKTIIKNSVQIKKAAPFMEGFIMTLAQENKNHQIKSVLEIFHKK